MKRQRALFLSLALTACAAPPPAAPPSAVPAPAPAAGTRYRIDPSQSELRVLVYRAGPMASLGHNHVISTHSLQGWVVFGGNAGAAAFALTVPVADFMVDDPARRAAEGADFAEGVNDEARSGTLHNMLGPSVLNAAEFPVLKITSLSVSGASGALRARVVLEVAGHESTLVVPFVLDASPRRLAASGEVSVSQSSIGLAPFSIFLGALKVQDDLKVKFKFVAVPAGV